MNFIAINEIVGELAVLKFYPPDPESRLAVVKLVGKIAHSEDEARWLVARMLVLYNEWPGPRELRACFCSRFSPADGIEASSEKYLEGIPSERPRPAPLLTPGREEARRMLESIKQPESEFARDRRLKGLQ